ncbi:hypothetical protein D9756_006903 [Leucocoprinus leucothites]|uniref:Uncharacterized protein n=1 Tax=Leucocoprinus leucothites TaxID=201217 RepID=A0A8H5FYD2_9AGAR|nr:hypothetical protein D9756_006903 [Leucoagaricus leucothites]
MGCSGRHWGFMIQSHCYCLRVQRRSFCWLSTDSPPLSHPLPNGSTSTNHTIPPAILFLTLVGHTLCERSIVLKPMSANLTYHDMQYHPEYIITLHLSLVMEAYSSAVQVEGFRDPAQ